jgi:hypothetical protein
VKRRHGQTRERQLCPAPPIEGIPTYIKLVIWRAATTLVDFAQVNVLLARYVSQDIRNVDIQDVLRGVLYPEVHGNGLQLKKVL